MPGHEFMQGNHKVMVVLIIGFRIDGYFPEVLPGKEKVDVTLRVRQTTDVAPLIGFITDKVHHVIPLATMNK